MPDFDDFWKAPNFPLVLQVDKLLITSQFTVEFRHDLQILKPKLIISCSETIKLVKKVVKDLDLKSDVCLLDDLLKLQIYNRPNSEVIPEPVNITEQTAVILFTSGTSGLPKGAQLTHANLMVFHYGTKIQWEAMKLQHNQNVRVLTVAPFSLAMGFLIMIQNVFAYESTTVFLEHFNDHLFLESIQKYRVNMTIIVPPLLIFLLKTEIFDQYDLTSLKEIMCGSALITKHLELAVKKRFNNNIFIRQVYGMTESSAQCTMQMEEDNPGSVGIPMKGIQAKIIDEDGRILGPFQNGEICLRGSRVMKGYYGDEKATGDTIDREGWLHTGDILYYDNENRFYFVERKKELIKFNAYQVLWMAEF